MVKTVVILRKGGTPPETISKSIADLCTLFNLQTEEVCSGVVQLNAVSREFFFRIIELDN